MGGAPSACFNPGNKTVKTRVPSPSRPRSAAETLPCSRRRRRTRRSGVALPPHDVGRGAHQRRKRPADFARQHSHGAQAHGARRTEAEPPGLLFRPAPSSLVALRPRAVHALSSTWTKRLSMTSWLPAKVSHGHSRHLAPPWLEFLPQTRTVADAAHADGPHQPTHGGAATPGQGIRGRPVITNTRQDRALRTWLVTEERRERAGPTPQGDRGGVFLPFVSELAGTDDSRSIDMQYPRGPGATMAPGPRAPYEKKRQ